MIVKKIINEWDPIGLMGHAPDDEYEIEITQIANMIYAADTVEIFADIIRNVFIQSFGDDIFIKTKEECIAIAEKIMSCN